MSDDYFQNSRSRSSSSAGQPLPSPSDTPYATPYISIGSPPSSTPLTPPPLPPLKHLEAHHRDEADFEFHRDETDFDLEPRRDEADFDPEHFTPTLHASLVQQILSLRREVESKHSFIEDLESSLLSTRSENETLQNNLKRTGMETRALKRELQLHEDGTLSAMEALSKERDESNDANLELRRKMDASQKRLRVQDEDHNRFRSTMEQERQKWILERRALERRVHLAEQRLTAVVDEVVAKEAQDAQAASAADGTRSETASIRSSFESPEKLRLSRKRSVGSVREISHSLADELDFSDKEDENADSKHTSRFTSPTEAREARERERDSQDNNSLTDRGISNAALRAAHIALTGVSEKDFAAATAGAQNSEGPKSRVLGLVSSFESAMRTVVQEQERTSSLAARSHSVKSKSPQMKAEEAPPLPEQATRDRLADMEAHTRQFSSETRKRRADRARTLSDPFPGQMPLYFELPLPHRRPLSPPQSPPSSTTADSLEHVAVAARPMHSVSTQTEELPSVASTSAPAPAHTPASATASSAATATTTTTAAATAPPQPLRLPPPPPPPNRAPPSVPGGPDAVPAITLHPAPDGTFLVPRNYNNLRNVGTQTHFRERKRRATKSVGMQTEKIQIDKRLRLNRPPETVVEQAYPEPVQGPAEGPAQEPVREPTQEPESRFSFDNKRSSLEQARIALEQTRAALEQVTAGVAEKSEPSTTEKKAQQVKKRTSLMSSPPLVSSDDKAANLEALDEMHLSDVEKGSALSKKPSIKSTQRYSIRAFDPPAPVPEHSKISTSALYTRSRLSMSSRGGSKRNSIDKGKKRVASLNTEALGQYQSRLARSSLPAAIESPTASQSSGFSSSAYSKTSGPKPPFAIPSRKSSKEQYTKIRYSKSTRQSSPVRRLGEPSSPARADSATLAKGEPPHMLRKSRSAAAINDTVIRVSDSLGEPAALGYTALNRVGKQITAPPNNIAYESRGTDNKQKTTQVAHIGTMFPTGSATAFSSMQHSVVDAITATTIGEWMFKYIRKRKSFGVSESEGNNERHKRWVWLSPYDRTIMWSTKQPATNSALMGKTGRKLSIQSVLDVKDDTPAPKEARATGVFSRSILVLTPARALKFTAVSRDRHYLWLTALSFLAHHSDKNVSKYNFQQDPSLQESVASTSGPSRPSKSKGNSEKGSGHETPVAPNAHPPRTTSRAPIADSAFAPAIPRLPHSRKRSSTNPSSNRAGGGLFSSLSSAHASTCRLTVNGNSSSRVQSIGRSASQRTPKTHDEDPAVTEQRGREGSRLDRYARSDASPGPSVNSASAEFGGNENFFDAVGVVKLDAFVRPTGSTPATASAAPTAKTSMSNDQRPDWNSHRRHESSGTFIGPPDISKTRPIRRAGTLRSGKEMSFFGL